ncbi:MAG TPA: cytochrome c [Steroidobacteraceae bacterium]
MAQGTGPQTPEQKAQVSVLTRQGLFKVQGFVFGPAGAMIRPGGKFDAAMAQKAGERLQITGGLIPELFANDTHTFSIPTKAREGIWTNKSDFDAKANDLVKAASELEMTAKGGDEAATKKAIIGVGKACGACHDQFRDK